MTKAITDLRGGTVSIYPEFDPYLEDIKEEEKILYDWDHLLDFNLDDIPLLGGEELLPFVRKMGKSNRKKEINGESDLVLLRYRNIFISMWKDCKKEEAVKRIKGEALKEKDDPEAFIFPIRLEGQVNKNALVDTGSDINTMPYRIYEQLGREEMKKGSLAKFLILDIPIRRDAPIVVGRGFLHTIGGIVNTPKRFFSTFDGFCHQTFHAARSDVIRNAKSDSDDEEDYEIKRNKFGPPIYGLKPTPYLNYNDPAERSLAIQIITNPFRKISVWKKAEHTMMGSDLHDRNALDNMKPWKRALPRVFSTYEFDEVCADDELHTKKIIKFRLGGRAHSLTLLEFVQRLGLYQAVELDEEGFNIYFDGGLRSDEHFNTQEYWCNPCPFSYFEYSNLVL
nr:hypothetical protein [Tanacetum cinerariifolium]